MRPLALSVSAVIALAGAPALSAADVVMAEGGAIRSPAGYLDYCTRRPDACAADRRPGGAPRRADAAVMAELGSVNRALNRAIRAAPEAPGSDRWTDDGTAGDCEDYALAKRRALVARGWAPDQLLIALARAPDGAPHAALIARTDRGDFVLDSLTDAVRRWDDADLAFTVRQSAGLPALWVRVAPR